MKTFNYDRGKNLFVTKAKLYPHRTCYGSEKNFGKDASRLGKIFIYICSKEEKHDKYTPNFQDCEEFFN